MNFYSINLLPLVDRSLAVIDDVPRELVDHRYRMATGIEMGNRYPTGVGFDMAAEMPGFKLASLIANAASLLIVSTPVKEIIEKARTGKIEYLPIFIYNHKKKLASQDYFVINPLGTYDCLDYEQSKIQYNKGDVVAVKKIVLDRKKVEHAPDLFRIQEAPRKYVISGRLVAKLKAIKATNFHLIELEQSAAKPR